MRSTLLRKSPIRERKDVHLAALRNGFQKMLLCRFKENSVLYRIRNLLRTVVKKDEIKMMTSEEDQEKHVADGLLSRLICSPQNISPPVEIQLRRHPLMWVVWLKEPKS